MGGRPERGDDLGAAHRLEATPRPVAASSSRSSPLRNSSASLQRPGGTRSAMSPRPKRSSGRSEVITASSPASSRCWRQARAVVDVVEVAHHLPVVEARVADVQLALARRRARARRRAAAASSSGVGPPEAELVRVLAQHRGRPSGSGISSPRALACARPQTISKNASVLQRGARLPEARARPGPGVPHRVWGPGRHVERLAGAHRALHRLRPARAARPRAPRSAPPGAGGSAPEAPGPPASQLDSTSSSSPPVSRGGAPERQGLAGDRILQHVSGGSPCPHYAETCRRTSIRAGQRRPEVDMKAFVTGGTGFIGGRLVRRLRERGDEVVALVRSPGEGGRAARAGLRAGRGRPVLRAGDPATGCRAATPSSTSRRSTRSASRPRERDGDVGRQRARHRAGARRRDRGGRAADRLRLDRRRVRQHPRRRSWTRPTAATARTSCPATRRRSTARTRWRSTASRRARRS